jgi:hypothetical protein
MENQMMQQQAVTVTINDIATMVQLIDVVTRRGGLQGNEIASVGMLRNKLEAYVQQNSPQQQQPEDTDVDVAGAQPQGPLSSKVAN